MSTMEPFDKKQTRWEGLWWHPEDMCFSSAVMNLAQLKKFKGNVRMYVKKNKYYNRGQNGRPNYLFSLHDASSDAGVTLEVEDAERTVDDIIQELTETLQMGQAGGYQVMLPSESMANAQVLMEKAIGLVEELTGEKWEFGYLTFG